MILRLTAMIFALVTILPASLFAREWEVEKEKSRIKFEIIVEGGIISGQFETFETKINFDPDNVSAAKIMAVIQSSSLKTDDKSAQGTALDKNWLFPRQFPEIIYQSNSVKKRAEGQFDSEGVLKVKGISHPITLPFSLKIEGQQAEATGRVKLERAMFNLGETADAGPYVEVFVHIFAKMK